MKTTLNILHHQSADWLRELEFYVEELAILSGRLEEINSHWKGDKEIMQQAKHFQNKFISLREHADVLKKDIDMREVNVEKIAERKPEELDTQMKVVDDKIFDRMAALTAGVAVTRYEFNKFLAKAM